MAQANINNRDLQTPSFSWPLWRVLRSLIRTGHLQVLDHKGVIHDFGDQTDKPVAICFRNARIERALLFDPQLALAEGYMDGSIGIEAGTIYDLLELLAKNVASNGLPAWMQLADKFRLWTRLARQRNDPRRARLNVSRHYDLPRSLYELFLDRDKQYSCAYFATGAETLEKAQLAKKHYFAAKLCLSPGLRVLDMGCGWGGLALYMAREECASVLGITLSEQQERYAKAWATRAGATDVTFRLCDYRALDETFDRIVSVGMFEHVGVPNYRVFFRKIADCLTDGGIALLSTIGRLSRPGAANPFIAKYIFPGGYVPALSEIVPAIEESGLLVTDIEVLRLHYANTLAAWRRNFEARWDQAASMLSERFCRMWQFYLAGCEAGFRYQDLTVFQIQLAKRIDAAPLTRDYLYGLERSLENAASASIQA